MRPPIGSKELSFFIVWSPKCGARSISDRGLDTLKKLLELNPLAKGDGALGFGPSFRYGRRSGEAQVLELCPPERCRSRAGQGVEFPRTRAAREARGQFQKCTTLQAFARIMTSSIGSCRSTNREKIS